METTSQIFSQVESTLETHGLKIEAVDNQRPWGGFFVIEETDAKKFIDIFFFELSGNQALSGRLSPKILIVAPGKKLSWQYHYRRSEIWKLIEGTAALARSNTDQEQQSVNMQKGELVELKQGERHRLIGTDQWGIVAEIWVHTDSQHLSDENDIVRLQDDFGR